MLVEGLANLRLPPQQAAAGHALVFVGATRYVAPDRNW